MSRLKNLQQLLSETVNSGAKITVITRPADEFNGENKIAAGECIKLLESIGVSVKFKGHIHQKFTVIDARTVWYGSVNFLSYGSAEESIMRFDSYDIAGELIDTIS